MFNDYGTAQDIISKVGIDKSEMVISAVRVQDTAKEFMPRRPNVMSDMFLEMANNPDKAPLQSHALFVNIPVCDLTNLDLKWDNFVCFYQDDSRPSDEAVFLDCLSYVLRESCSNYKVGGHSWPYDKNVHDFKTVPEK